METQKDEVMFYSLPSGNEIFQLRFKRIRVEATLRLNR